MVSTSIAPDTKWQLHRRLPLAEVARSPLLAVMLDWWRQRCQVRGSLIGRKSIDPVELPRRAFPHLSLLEFINEPEFRIRIVLAGDGVCSLFGRSLKGAFVDELYKREDYDIALHDIRDMIAAAQPTVVYREVLSRDDRLVSYFILMIPLASDGTTVDGILSVLDWQVDMST